MTPRERKAAFKAAVELNATTLGRAAQETIGVTWFHLREGLEGRRSLSVDVQEKFAAYISRPVAKVFPAKRSTTAVA